MKFKFTEEQKAKLEELYNSGNASRGFAEGHVDTMHKYNQNQSKAWLFGYVTGVNGAAFDIVLSETIHKVKNKFKK